MKNRKIVWKHEIQKQPFRGILRKRCSENMQQIYRRTPMPKFDFNKNTSGRLLLQQKSGFEKSP